jgi:hypothetical protein
MVAMVIKLFVRSAINKIAWSHILQAFETLSLEVAVVGLEVKVIGKVLVTTNVVQPRILPPDILVEFYQECEYG